MPHRQRQFVNGEIYHIVIRRMGEEELFLDVDDYYRGIFCIYEFNTSKPITIRERRQARVKFKKSLRGSLPGIGGRRDEIVVMEDSRDLLVEILTFSFMPNHIHLLVRQLKEGGISKFMLKLESGYAAYFKSKYGVRMKGHFFQDRFKVVYIKNNEQLMAVFIYIHINPIALIEPHWKEKGIQDTERAIKFLEEEYRWSSFFDYIGKRNFPSVTKRDFLIEVMGGSENCKQIIENWIRHKGKITQELPPFSLE